MLKLLLRPIQGADLISQKHVEGKSNGQLWFKTHFGLKVKNIRVNECEEKDLITCQFCVGVLITLTTKHHHEIPGVGIWLCRFIINLCVQNYKFICAKWLLRTTTNCGDTDVI